LTRELNRFKSITPPTQKRTIDDVDRRINLLFDLINCATVDAKIMPGLHQLCQAIEARNQQAALGLHVQLASSSSGGDMSTVLVGVKLLISKMNQQ
jgi:protein transport protein SEC31